MNIDIAIRHNFIKYNFIMATGKIFDSVSQGHFIRDAWKPINCRYW